jgi:hypothetical protein
MTATLAIWYSLVYAISGALNAVTMDHTIGLASEQNKRGNSREFLDQTSPV